MANQEPELLELAYCTIECRCIIHHALLHGSDSTLPFYLIRYEVLYLVAGLQLLHQICRLPFDRDRQHDMVEFIVDVANSEYCSSSRLYLAKFGCEVKNPVVQPNIALC